MNASLARSIIEACRVLHDPASPGADISAANLQLIEACGSHGAAETCEAMLSGEIGMAPAGIAVAVLCAGVVSEAALRVPNAAAQTSQALLRLASTVAFAPAALRLTVAAISLVVDLGAEDAFLSSADFAALGPLRLSALCAVADELAARWAPEEVALRPSAARARRIAAQMLEEAVVQKGCASAFECFGKWANAAGIGLNELQAEHPRLLFAMLAAVGGIDAADASSLETASKAGVALCECARASLESEDQVEMDELAHFIAALAAFAPALKHRVDLPVQLLNALAECTCVLFELAGGALRKELGGPAPSHLARGLCEMAVECLSHPCPAVAEAGAQGLEAFIAQTLCGAAFLPRLCAEALRRVLLRASFEHLAGETGEDAQDLFDYRRFYAVPLIRALAAKLGGDWPAAVAERVALAQTLYEIEVGLWAVNATTPTTANGGFQVLTEALRIVQYVETAPLPGCDASVIQSIKRLTPLAAAFFQVALNRDEL
mmetsp:Transcript_20483/g.70734  ORF Transcript_20483/g.70734 Transcript_20483/m.70734 type:complete len:493 (-) Transcript_20483:24-1502(-)